MLFRRILRGGIRSFRSLPEAAVRRRWGVVQPVGHLTVNEDGEGSNPSAPANLIDSPLFIFRFSNKTTLSNNWIASAPAAQSDSAQRCVAGGTCA